MGCKLVRGYFILLLIIVIMSTVFALENVQTLGQIKQGDSIILKQNCVNVTYATITSISVNGATTQELISSPLSMVLVSNAYQTYNFTNSSIVGQYIVTGTCDEGGVAKAWSYNYEVTPTGQQINAVAIAIYVFFLLLCAVIIWLSVLLIKNNRGADDKLTDHKLYDMQKAREMSFYLTLLKRKLWIVGTFGIYLSILLLFAVLDQIVFNLNLVELNQMLNNLMVILSWGLVPFVLFWIAYIIIYFFQKTKDIMKFQFGNFTGRDAR